MVALICVPTMLFPKPFYIDSQNKLHAHHAAHDDALNKESIPLEEKKLETAGGDGKEKGLLDHP